MITITLWFLIMPGASTNVFPSQFATQAKCEQAKIELWHIRAYCMKAEVINNK